MLKHPYSPHLTFICFVIAIICASYLTFIVQPLMVSVLIGVLCTPIINKAETKGLNRTVSSVAVLVVLITLATLSFGSLSKSLMAFNQELPAINSKLQELILTLQIKAESHGLEVDFLSLVDMSLLGSITYSLAGTATNFLAQTFLIFLMSLFMLVEAPRWSAKFTELMGADFVENALKALKGYLGVKLLTSTLTGLFIAVGLLLLKNPYWVSLGLIAFLLNFIPNIGSIIAAIPATLIALTTGETSVVFITIGIYLIANAVIGSIIEPRLMGQKMGISTLVVLLSMLVWGSLFGLIGILLSTPITVVIKLVIDAKTATKENAVSQFIS